MFPLLYFCSKFDLFIHSLFQFPFSFLSLFFSFFSFHGVLSIYVFLFPFIFLVGILFCFIFFFFNSLAPMHAVVFLFSASPHSRIPRFGTHLHWNWVVGVPCFPGTPLACAFGLSPAPPLFDPSRFTFSVFGHGFAIDWRGQSQGQGSECTSAYQLSIGDTVLIP